MKEEKGNTGGKKSIKKEMKELKKHNEVIETVNIGKNGDEKLQQKKKQLQG